MSTMTKGKPQARVWAKGLVALALVMTPALSQAQVWYIATNGNDSADCTDKITPCKTLQGVHDKPAVVAGDEIWMQEGTYSTTSGTQIALTKALTIYGGYYSTYTQRRADPAKTIIQDTRANTAVRLLSIATGHDKWTTVDGLTLKGLVSSAASTGAVYINGARVKMNNVAINNNKATLGGGIYLNAAGDRLELTNSSVSKNIASTGEGGGIYAANAARLMISSTIIDNNQVTTSAKNGGGIYLAGKSVAELFATTIYGNKATGSGGGIYLTGAATSLRCTHCTVVSNTSTTAATAGRNVVAATSSSLYFKNSVVINADKATPVANGWNVTTTGATFSDGGYNAWGINNEAGFAGATAPVNNGNRINAQAAISDLFTLVGAEGVGFHGGAHRSLKPVKTSPLIDAIPNDPYDYANIYRLPASSTGTSPAYPFESIAQARRAMSSYESYKADYYFFDLNGQTFRTYVDKNGFVMVASAAGSAATSLTSSTNLTFQSDGILPSASFAQMDVDEIRINAPTSKLGDFDVVTQNATNITRLKSFQPLKNNWDLFSQANYTPSPWFGTHDNRMNGATASDDSKYTTMLLSHNVIGHADVASNLHWQMARTGGPYMTVRFDTTSPRDPMNLWVRSAAGNCGGVVTTDQRGLPLPDYVNPNDPNQYGDVRDCDIGAFEWNEGYRLDCYPEDGMRPENSLSAGSASLCVEDLNDLTPKAFIDNFGYSHWSMLLMLALFDFARRQQRARRPAAQASV